MKPIPFNLERAKAGDPILCHGEPAIFGGHNPDAREWVKVVYWDLQGLLGGTNEGGFCGSEQRLTMAPKKQAFWVNVYPSAFGADRYKTKEEADRGAGYQRIACVRVEFEEGEGL